LLRGRSGGRGRFQPNLPCELEKPNLILKVTVFQQIKKEQDECEILRLIRDPKNKARENQKKKSEAHVMVNKTTPL
jgi:hypothetical protein